MLFSEQLYQRFIGTTLGLLDDKESTRRPCLARGACNRAEALMTAFLVELDDAGFIFTEGRPTAAVEEAALRAVDWMAALAAGHGISGMESLPTAIRGAALAAWKRAGFAIHATRRSNRLEFFEPVAA